MHKLLLLITFALSSCAVPRGAITSSEIVDAGSKTIVNGITYHLVSMNNVRTELLKQSTDGYSDPHVAHKNNPRELVIRAGDTISLKIWDSSDNSLLTPVGQRYSDINNIVVRERGHVFLPYIGTVNVLLKSFEELRKELQKDYAEYIPSAQMQISWAPGPNNSVEVISEKTGSKTVGLQSHNVKISSLIATSGISLSAYTNPRITLRRRNTESHFAYSDFLKQPKLDLILEPNDQLILTDDARSFSVLGASGAQRQINFDKNKITVVEAATMAGGFDENRADLQGVFVLRGMQKSNEAPSEIFAFDLTSVEGLFAAKAFNMRDKDLYYVTEAEITTIDRVAQIAGRLLGIGSKF